MRVAEISRFPVKSMGGEVVESAHVSELGIDGDRRWSVHDVETGTTLTARRTPELLFASARLEGADVVVALPDGTELGAADDAALSSWLGRDVELRSADEHAIDVGGTYEVPLDAEADADWVSWQGPAGAFHDSGRTRVSLVSTDTLGGWDRRRFRSNLVVDGGGEDELVGRTVSIGGVRLEVTGPVARCVMVVRPQPGLGRELAVLRSINAERAGELAVGCLVARPGEISVGDLVEEDPDDGDRGDGA
ncbi:MOSC domain-containing protein [Ilumatobacter sp.]|uniref:MOSC domain-containing protein n=1 Tax=Ilumatobacter sp. TaxID=1967498 RepID=UPI003B51A23E